MTERMSGEVFDALWDKTWKICGGMIVLHKAVSQIKKDHIRAREAEKRLEAENAELREGKTLIGTCADCNSKDECIIQDFINKSFGDDVKSFGCAIWEKKND